MEDGTKGTMDSRSYRIFSDAVYDIWNPFRPLFISMRLLGLPTFNLQNPLDKGKLSFRNKMLCFYLHLCVLNNSASLIYYEKDRWIQSLDVLRCLSAVIPLNIYIYKRKQIQNLGFLLKRELSLREFGDMKMKRTVQIVVGCAWFIIIILVTCLSLFACVLGLEDYLRGDFFNVKIESVTFTGATIICFVDLFFFSAFLWGSCLFLVTFFFLACVLISRLLESLRNDINNLKHKRSSSNEKELCICRVSKRLYLISDIISIIEDVFSVSLLWWILEVVLFILVTVTSLISKEGHGEAAYVGTNILNVTYIIGTFLVLTLSASSVFEAGENCASALSKVAYSLSTESTDRKIQFLTFESQLRNSQLFLSGWKFFIVSRSFMVSVVAAILTYCTVLHQFSDETVHVKKNSEFD